MAILAILALTFLSGLSLGVLIGDAAAWHTPDAVISKEVE